MQNSTASQLINQNKIRMLFNAQLDHQLIHLIESFSYLQNSQYVYFFHIIIQMGKVLSRPQLNSLSQQQLNASNSLHTAQQSQASPFAMLQSSNKSIHDIIGYIQSLPEGESEQQKLQRVCFILKQIKQREKIYHLLNSLEKYFLGINNQQKRIERIGRQNLSQLFIKKLVIFIHAQLSNIWFLWSQIQRPGLTASTLHDSLIPQMAQIPYSMKLQILYNQSSGHNFIYSEINTISQQTIIEQAIRTNYPFLICHETLKQLFTTIIQEEVIVNIPHFTKFVDIVIRSYQGKKEEYKDYVERLFGLKQEGDQKQFQLVKEYLERISEEKYRNCNIIEEILSAGRVFLELGYPQGLQLIFNSVMGLRKRLKKQEKRLYLYTEIYCLFLYKIEEINLQFKQLEQMQIQQIIHLLLRDNKIENLNLLRKIFSKISEFEDELKIREKSFSFITDDQVNYNFEAQLQQYLFSHYCNLRACLQIVSARYLSFEVENELRTINLVKKINQCKFESVIQNQQAVKEVLSFLPNCQAFTQKMQELLQVTRLLYMFGVNEKFVYVSTFYFPIQEAFEQKSITLQQQRALYVFKCFISKFYIYTDRNRKIMLSPKSEEPINIDLSKAESVFQITLFLYDKLFHKYLNSTNELHQLVFQHMIYFYKYDDAKSILSNKSVINRYQIIPETFEFIILNNIIEAVERTKDLTKILPDLKSQLKLIKNCNSIEMQNVSALVKLVQTLSDYGINLTIKNKEHIGVDLLEEIAQNYSENIENIPFDRLYNQIKCINANYLRAEEEQFLMSNELLKFKCTLAKKAYEGGKKKFANELLDEISRFNPPWLTTQLIKILKNNSSLQFDKRIYSVALQFCSKGQDLRYLMQLWREKQGKNLKKQKGFAEVTDYFETGRKYLVIDDQLIKNDDNYRNYVAQCQFNDQILHLRKYQLFFSLLGSQPDRAFHYALKTNLDSTKIEIFMRQAAKADIMDCYASLRLLHKYFYFVLKIDAGEIKVGSFISFKNLAIDKIELQQMLKDLRKRKNRSIKEELYKKILSGFLCSLHLPERFLNTYFHNSSKQARSLKINYELLYDQQSRKKLLLDLNQEFMGRSDIIALFQVATDILEVNLVDLCLFSLCNNVNKSDQISEASQNLMQKIVTLTSESKQQCSNIVKKLIDKVFSIKLLVQILKFFVSRQNQWYGQIVKVNNLEVLEAVGLIEVGQQLHGLIDNNYFDKQIGLNPKISMSQNHRKFLRRVWTKTNIFVLSKAFYFIYGMNPDIETFVWQSYIAEHPEDEQLTQIKEMIDLQSGKQ